MTDDASVSIRLAEPGDEPVLWLMLTYAASMGEGGPGRIEEARADPYLRSYVEGFGSRREDLGFVAVAPTRRIVGAAWIRRDFEASALHVGGPAEPELSIGVSPEHRGQGIGERLLDALLRACRGRHPSIMLSVRSENPAVRLYRRTGFEEIDRIRNRVGGVSLVMRCRLD
ncbi:MAG: N-acetyltransferase [Myxococcota bacterium]